MTIVRRFLVLAILLFWQGGFVFYAAVVVPINREELGPRSKATVITNRVTYFFNLLGAGAMAPLLWDVSTPDPSARRRWVRFGLWVVLLATLLGQVFLYREMNAALPDILSGVEPPRFRVEHGAYIGISAAQVAASLCYLALMLLSWRATDRAEATPQAARTPD
jgi:hypothetical protein